MKARYSGKLDSPKSRASSRTAAIPASLSSELHTWLSILPPAPDAWIFPSETGLTPARPENVWRRWIGPRLEKIGLGGVNFQVLRRTHASLGHAAGIDPKVRADQMGNGIGVNLDEYTVTGLDQRTAAVELLEASILQ